MNERVILHADMDAFYASVEQRDHPEWRGKPVIVGAQSARGVVAAASYEARVFGVRSAMPAFRARELCPEGIFVGGDMAKYQRESSRIHRVFERYTDQIEPLALDEAFLDITGSLGLFGDPVEIGRAIKREVLETTGLKVSVGIGPNKLLAKMATSRGKPDGLFVIEKGEAEALLAPLPVRALFGIGPKTEERLVNAGLPTLGALVRAPGRQLARILGSAAEEIRLRARGIDERPVVSDRAAKSIGEESTFEADRIDEEGILSVLVSHAETVAARARRAGVEGRTVQLKVKLARRKAGANSARSNADLYPVLTRQVTFAVPTADGLTLTKAVTRLWRELGLGEPVRLLGVSLTQFDGSFDGDRAPRPPTQLDLFAPPPAPAPEEPSTKSAEQLAMLNRALDSINERYGAPVVHRGAAAPDKLVASDRLKLGELPASKKRD